MVRRGAMMVELATAAALVGALLTVCLQLFSAAATARRAADQRQCVIVEAANILEEIAARPWSDLTTATLAKITLSPMFSNRLPSATLKIEVDSPTKDANEKRIDVSIGWHDTVGQAVAPVRVTTWRYKLSDDLPSKKQ